MVTRVYVEEARHNFAEIASVDGCLDPCLHFILLRFSLSLHHARLPRKSHEHGG